MHVHYIFACTYLREIFFLHLYIYLHSKKHAVCNENGALGRLSQPENSVILSAAGGFTTGVNVYSRVVTFDEEKDMLKWNILEQRLGGEPLVPQAAYMYEAVRVSALSFSPVCVCVCDVCDIFSRWSAWPLPTSPLPAQTPGNSASCGSSGRSSFVAFSNRFWPLKRLRRIAELPFAPRRLSVLAACSKVNLRLAFF